MLDMAFVLYPDYTMITTHSPLLDRRNCAIIISVNPPSTHFNLLLYNCDKTTL